MAKSKQPSSAQPKAPQAQPAATTSRYVISNRLSGQGQSTLLRAMRDSFDSDIKKGLAANINILSDSASFETATEGSRRVLLVEADKNDLVKIKDELSSNMMIEPELPRVPAVIDLAEAALQSPGGSETANGAGLMPPGNGTTLTVTINSNGAAVAGVPASLILTPSTFGRQGNTSVLGTTSSTGAVSFQYDNSLWTPGVLFVQPINSYWPIIIRQLTNGATIELPALPKTGPVGWWQAITGNTAYSETRGRGIKVGVIDTGVGPHPYLSHINKIGSFIGGQYNSSPDSTNDVENHGTHVSGIIGARPTTDSGDFGGIASGADIFVARVFAAGQSANQGDIANAVDVLTRVHSVDLINMSFGGAYSAIELDAIMFALEQGTLCICAAGNNNGGPLLYPAAYAQTVGISAIGLTGTTPPTSASAAFTPTQQDRFGIGGTYLASFSNFGAAGAPQIVATAGGNGIISTVPVVSGGVAAPYLAMDGTSMASPAATAATAALLSADQGYFALPRTSARAAYAYNALLTKAKSIGLNAVYQGRGLVSVK